VLREERRLVDDDAVVHANDPVDRDRLVVHVLDLRAVGDEARVPDRRDALARAYDIVDVRRVLLRPHQLLRRDRGLQDANRVTGDAGEARRFLAARLRQLEQRAEQTFGDRVLIPAHRDHAEDAAHQATALGACAAGRAAR
jgi:hypothetical protein